MLFRLPFYLIGVIFWLPIGLVISFINLIALPAFGIGMIVFPSVFPNKAKDILSLGIFRRGMGNLNRFLIGR
jgi:hypothetical protein